jgi:putative lipase involved disintegration of autophagic bodies
VIKWRKCDSSLVVVRSLCLAASRHFDRGDASIGIRHVRFDIEAPGGAVARTIIHAFQDTFCLSLLLHFGMVSTCCHATDSAREVSACQKNGADIVTRLVSTCEVQMTR